MPRNYIGLFFFIDSHHQRLSQEVYRLLNAELGRIGRLQYIDPTLPVSTAPCLTSSATLLLYGFEGVLESNDLYGFSNICDGRLGIILQFLKARVSLILVVYEMVTLPEACAMNDFETEAANQSLLPLM